MGRYSRADTRFLLRRLENQSSDLEKPNFYHPFRMEGEEPQPQSISLKKYCQELADFMADNQGICLQGFHASGTQIAIFRQQSVFWQTIAKDYIDTCYAATLEFLQCAMVHVAGQYTGEKLMHAFIDRSFHEIGNKLDEKLQELLWPYLQSHPSTQDPRYSSRVSPGTRLEKGQSSANNDDDDGKASVFIDSWTERAQMLNWEHELVFAAEALDMTDAYYDVRFSLLLL